MSIPDIVAPTPEAQETAAQHFNQSLTAGRSSGEVMFRCKDGSDLYILVQSVKLSEDKFIGFCMDITERKQAEEEMQRLRNVLQNIVDSMPSVLVGIDAAGRVTQWNREAEQAGGLTRDEAQGRALTDVLPQFREEMECIRQVIRERKPHKQARIRQQDRGETRFTDMTIYPLIANGVEGAVIRIDDVTARIQFEEMMIQTEKMMSVGGLAAGMAHEINNPLSGILQSAQNMLRRTSPELPRNIQAAQECGTDLNTIRAYLEARGIFRFIETIRTSGERAAEIVTNMLNFSRRSDSSKEPVNLLELLDKTVELASTDYDLKKHYDFRSIDIERDYDPDLPNVPCVNMEISQVILNVLRNAAQALINQDAPAAPPKITLRLRQDGDMACIDVEDNGPGMDEATRKRVFEPFFTTKEVGVGTGLGLSVSYFIITNNHRGTMTVTSSPGKGATFCFRLPLVKGETE